MSRTTRQVFVIGSINIDHIYQNDHVVRPAESLPTKSYRRAIGGKGLNQAFAMYKAGLKNVQYHGMVGYDGEWMVKELKTTGFPTDHIRIDNEIESGHTIIQSQEKSDGENAVILHYGANYCWSEPCLTTILDTAQPGDWLVIQGETNQIDLTLQVAKRRGMVTVFNPAPYPPPASLIQSDYPSDWLIVNRIEAEAILGASLSSSEPRRALDTICKTTGATNAVLTLGSLGCQARIRGESGVEYYTAPAVKVDVVDTTGAGDVFLGFFLSALLGGEDDWQSLSNSKSSPVETALTIGCMAAALAVTKLGALDSIPSRDQVLKAFLI